MNDYMHQYVTKSVHECKMLLVFFFFFCFFFFHCMQKRKKEQPNCTTWSNGNDTDWNFLKHETGTKFSTWPQRGLGVSFLSSWMLDIHPKHTSANDQSSFQKRPHGQEWKWGTHYYQYPGQLCSTVGYFSNSHYKRGNELEVQKRK